MSDQTSRIQGLHRGDDLHEVRREAGTGAAGRDAHVSSADEQLLLRCWMLMDDLAEAGEEIVAALEARDVVVVKACGRRLMSLGWLLKEAGDKHSAGSL